MKKGQEERRVVAWVPHSYETKCSVGWLGGWFNREGGGDRWVDYLGVYYEETHPYLEAIRRDVIAKGLRLTGEDHENHQQGTPLFDDGTVGKFSWRAWGDLMAAIWSTEEGIDYNYMDFYM
jgi:hypothetical protein